MKTCNHCGKLFKSRTRNQKYCCVACYNLHQGKRKLPHTEYCLNCGIEFEPTQPQYFYCSKQCELEYKSGDPALLAIRQKRKNDPLFIKTEKTLSDYENEARQCGLDYATYRGLLSLGKSFEDIKALKRRE